MARMTHRERVWAALSHQEPDVVPIDLASTIDSSIVVEGYERLKERLGVRSENVLTNRMMRVVEVDSRILEMLDIDTRGVFPAGPPDEIIGQDRYRDEWGVERVKPAGSFYYDEIAFPLAGDITVGDIARYPMPDPHDPIRTQGLKEHVGQIHDLECAAVLNLPSAFVHKTQYLRGFADWFMDFRSDHKAMAALFDAVLDVSLVMCEELLREVGSEVDVVLTADDLGIQRGLMISPEDYRALIKPRHAKYFRLIHDMTPAKVLFHTCGSVVDIMDDLVEIGVDVLHPVQVTARGMEPTTLKARWGDRMAFWGAIDTQYVLCQGGVDQVRTEVARRVEELGRGGGYVLGAVHNIQPDVPVENVLAMYQYAREYRPSFAR
jgi:uroporphyrinogen decarboxylase